MEFKVKYCIGALLLLFTWTISAEDTSFKAKFGEEFGTDLRKYHAEMLHSNMDHYEELFNLLLRDTKPTPDDEKRFKSHLETVKHIKSQIGESVGIPLIKEIKSFGKIVIPELVLYRLGRNISGKEEGNTTQTILERFAQYEKKDAKDFQKKMYKRFHEMYKKIPAEELEKYDEYTEIDNLLERVTNRSTEKSGTLENIMEYVSIFRKFGDFFEYPEYKEIFA